jgi:cytochrome c oxidase subunit II
VRRGSIVRVVAIGVVVGIAATAVAILIPWLPDQASEEGGRIDFVFWFVTTICIVIFAVVAAVSVYSVFKFRVRPDDDSDGPPIHGHTGLEIAWTAVPAALVTAIAVVSAVALAQNQSLPKNKLVVEVTARQFAWSFKYPQYGGIESGTLRLQNKRGTELRLRALDVIHSFFVPEFRQKQDAVPGQVTKLAITPKKTGDYPLECTELCGIGHALMRTRAIVMSKADFERWARSQPGKGAGTPG